MAEDNLSLQHDLENMHIALTKSSINIHRLQHENQLMRSQLSRHFGAGSKIVADGADQQMSLLESSSQRLHSRSDSMNTKLLSEVEHWRFKASNLQDMLDTCQRSTQSNCNLLMAKFVPFENCAFAVEHSANLILERFSSSADVVLAGNSSENEHKESLLCTSSDNIASFPTCSSPSRMQPNVLEMTADHASLQDKLRALQVKYDTDVASAGADVNRYREMANHHESMFRRSFMSSLVEKFDSLESQSTLQSVDFGARSESHLAAKTRRALELVAEASRREQTAKTELESYREVLSSYEDELNDAWIRESELSKEVQSLSIALNKLREHHHAASTKNQTPSFLSNLPPPVSRNTSFKKSFPRSDKLLLETTIPPTDSSFDIQGIFALQLHQILPLLTRQIATHHDCQRDLTRLMQASAHQDREQLSYFT